MWLLCPFPTSPVLHRLVHSVVGYRRPDQSVNRVYTPVLLAAPGALSSLCESWLVRYLILCSQTQFPTGTIILRVPGRCVLASKFEKSFATLPDLSPPGEVIPLNFPLYLPSGVLTELDHPNITQ